VSPLAEAARTSGSEPPPELLQFATWFVAANAGVTRAPDETTTIVTRRAANANRPLVAAVTTSTIN
jgi:hypothetical protein